MTNAASRLTVLTTLGIPAVKTFTKRKTDDRVHVEGYGSAKRFRAREIETDDDGMWLRRLLKKKHSFVVLGEPIDWPEGELRRRLSEDDGEDRATLRDVPREWMPVDLDHLNFEPMAEMNDGETLACEALQMLGLRGSRCLWHLTSSHGVQNRYRIRLWLSLKNPVTCAAMKRFAMTRWKDLTVDEDGKTRACVDTSILRPAQPIYTGTPVFDGLEDPVDRRVGLIEGKRLRIRNVEPEERKRDEGQDDENIERLRDAGLYIRPAPKPGHHMIVCPWEENHSGEAKDNDTFYYQPNYEGREEPFFRCFHESCQKENRWWRDVEQKMGWSSVFEKVKKDDDDAGGEEEEFVYVHRLEQFWDPRDGVLISTKAFDSMKGHSGGRSKKGSPTEQFLASRRTAKADAMEFLPGSPRVVRRNGVTVLNTYIDQRMAPEAGDASMWTDHLTWLIPDEAEREQLMDWLAFAYQRPGEKITWAPILYGPPGTGKTTVFNCLAECIGPAYMSEPTQSELEDRFNEWAFGKLLVKIEELMSDNKYSVAEKLKPVIANPTVSIRGLHKSAFKAANVANVCASTNHMHALPIEKSDRRYMIIRCVDAGKRERRPRMKRLWRWIEEHGYGVIAQWLSERDVSRFRPKSEAPETELKKVVAEASMTELDRAIELCEIYDREDLVTSSALMQMFEDNAMRIYPNKLGMIAMQRGWKSLDGQSSRTMHGERKITLWTPTGKTLLIEKVREMEPDERRRFLDKLNAKRTFQAESAREKADDRWKPR